MNDTFKKLPQNMPLTTVVKHTIRPGLEEDFEKWLKSIGKKVSKFNGFKGKYVIRPDKNKTKNEYTVAFQFENLETLSLWMNSEERKEAIEKLDSFSLEKMQLKHHEGIDFWFTLPETKQNVPPKWKMATLTWCAVFPGVVILSLLFKGIFPDINSTIITLFVTLALVPLLTWVLMPNLVKLFKFWLFDNKH
ncbi:antibiotic biosynthesis monooxygenase [Tenacibaculum xiamenense]|uniref:antibiotic biosynthesis monooxygenase n=1 Tax=Tenacibaculum xiamenense TaxID=1261553 RepID=UPI003895BCC9